MGEWLTRLVWDQETLGSIPSFPTSLFTIVKTHVIIFVKRIFNMGLFSIFGSKPTFDKSKFYTNVRTKFQPLAQVQVNGFEAILAATDGQPLSHRAYALATAWHETNKTMQPVREAYWLTENWRKNNLRYYPWYGRGYVQITWEKNYARADRELNLNGRLLANADVAMELPVAAGILRKGMDEGWFTGIKLSDYLPAQGGAILAQYIKARKIINGTDKANIIAGYASVFEWCLSQAGYK